MAGTISVTSMGPEKCRVTRRSPLTGQDNSMDLEVGGQKILDFYDNKIPGTIQSIFPELDATEREFLLTGYTQADWDRMFPPEEE